MKKKRITAALTAVLMFVTMLPASVSAAGSITDVEWWNFRNNEENNGVTPYETPTDYKETALKWANKVAENYNEACTPPLILDGYIYTAQDRYVYKLDKETGETKATSVKLAGQVGYALNPILYAEGMLFIQINNGRVQALDAKTLESLWVSEPVGGQTLSPITYKNGRIYSGTWTSEVKDGTYFCLTVKDEDPTSASEVKKCQWQFRPSEKGDTAKGFYWAGSYATDNYVAFGTDDGSREGQYTATASFYTVDPETGAVIDKLTGLDGDIRTTAVYSGGYLYFATKGGSLYKAPVDEAGNLGAPSSIELSGMMTAAPLVYNGRIYIGVCGQGGQFNADGGHMFAVVNDDETLSSSSLAYTVPIKGYPQAAALLSTAAEKEDLNGDGKADQRVYVYFTYNAFPGGIYYMTDEPGQTSGKATLLYTPTSNMQQYCISTICCDREGTLYYKNDTGYLMAVSKNRAYIEDIDVTAGTGEVKWSRDFNTGYTEYDLVTLPGTTSVDITLTAPEDMTLTIDGAAYPEGRTCLLDADGTKQVNVTATKTDTDGTVYSRTYVLNIRGKSSNAELADLKISTSNTWESALLNYEPVFDPQVTEYTTELLMTERKFVNVWPVTAESTASVKVYPVENVQKKGWSEEGDIEVTGTAARHDRYAVYMMPGKTSATVRIQVTSEDGAQTKDYLVTIARDASVSGSGITLDHEKATLYTKGSGKSLQLTATLDNAAGTVQWESSDPSVATVKDGVVRAKAPGKVQITASAEGVETTAVCSVTVKKPVLKVAKTKLKVKAKKKVKIRIRKLEPEGKVTYRSGNKKIAKVTAKGVVKGVKAGKTRIKVSCNGITKTVKITVKK